MTAAVVFQQFGWHVIPWTLSHDGRRFLDAALALVSQVLHLDSVVIVLACRGVATMLAPKQHNNAEVFAWVRGSDANPIVQFSPEGKDLPRHFPTKALAYEFEGVDNGKVVWTEVCYIQCLCARAQATRQVSEVAPHIPLLAGVGVRRRHVIVKTVGFDDHDEEPKPGIASLINVQLWFPPKQILDFLKAVSKVARARPDG